MLSRYDPFDVQSDIMPSTWGRSGFGGLDTTFDKMVNQALNQANQFMNQPLLMNTPTIGGTWNANNIDRAPCDIQETNDAYIYTLEVPAFEKEKLKVSLTTNRLEVEGTMADLDQLKEKDFVSWRRQERNLNSFKRSFRLPSDAHDKHDPQVSLTNGILRIVVKKSAPSEKKLLTIN